MGTLPFSFLLIYKFFLKTVVDINPLLTSPNLGRGMFVHSVSYN